VTTLAEHNRERPEWIRFPDEELRHSARMAFAAWLHATSGCVLLKLWYADPYLCVAGEWVYEVRHPDGRRRDAWVASVREATDETRVLDSAARVAERLVDSVQQAKE